MDERKSHHDADMKRNLVIRMKKIEGQIRGITRMIEEDAYCDEVLTQMSSVESALNGARKIILEAHIRSCVVEQLQSGKNGVIDELMKTIGRMSR